MPESNDAETPGSGAPDRRDPSSVDDSLEGLDLELYARVDRLAEEFREQLGRPGALAAEAFAARHPELRSVLLPALRAVTTLDRGESAAGGPLVGETLGRFRIVGQLGRGGMGVVYEAAEEGLERTVALKVLDGATTTPGFRQRFVREARAAARLAHPAIVPVYGSGSDGDLLWYAMRRIEGVALDALLAGLSGEGEERRRAEGALAAAARAVESDSSTVASASSGSGGAAAAGAPRYVAVARIGQRLASALAYAHAEGVVHRDIKPGNVILDPHGQPHLTDFGLCKLEGDASLTEASDVIGTLRYLPPEGLTGEVDERGDVYGLGLVLYELVAREPAFPRVARAQILHAIERQEPTSLRRLDPGVPRDLERIVAKAMSKLPEERYQRASDLADDLGAFLAGKPIRARPLGLLYYLRLLIRRNRVAAAAIAASFLALVAAAALYVVRLRTLLDDAETARIDAEVAADDAERRESLASLKFARAQLEGGDVGGAQELLKLIPEERRGWAWHHLEERVATGDPPRVLTLRRPEGVAWMPDRERFLVWSKTAVQLVDEDTLRRRAALTIGHLNAMGVPEWEFQGAVPTPDGAILATRSSEVGFGDGALRSHELVRWSGERRERAELIAELEGLPRALASSACAERAAFAVGEAVRVVDFTGEGPRLGPPIALEGMSPVTVISVLDDGRLALGGLAGEVAILDPATGALDEVTRHETKVVALACEGDRVVASAERRGLVLFHPRDVAGAHLDVAEVDGEIASLTPIPGRRLLAGLVGGRVACIDVPSRAVVETSSYFVSSAIAALPGGTGGPTLVSEYGRVKTWRPAARCGEMTVASGVGIAMAPAVGPAGDRIAFTSFDGHAHLVRPEGAIRVPAESNTVRANFKDDGRLVALGGLVLDADSGDEVLRWPPPAGECVAADFMGDSLVLLAWWQPEGMPVEFRQLDLFAWDAATPDEPPRFVTTVLDRVAYYTSPFLHTLDDTREVVVGGAGGEIVRLAIDDGAVTWGGVLADSNGCFAVDDALGLVLASGGPRGLITFDLANGEQVERGFGDLSPIAMRGSRLHDIRIHAGAGRAVTASRDGVLRIWSWPEAEELYHREEDMEFVFGVTWAPDGEAVYASTAMGAITRVGTGPVPAFARVDGALADPEEMARAALERLEADPEPEDWAAALSCASFLMTGSLEGLPADAPLALLARRLRERGIEESVYKRIVVRRLDTDEDEFTRFGWMPSCLFEDGR